jgi:hypothetical protein
MPVQIADVVVPAEFTQYITENSLVSTALVASGVAVPNGVMAAQLQAGAESFTVPVWGDIQDNEANVSTDNPADVSTPFKITAVPQNVRKSFLNQSWSEMSLASELSGSDALARIQSRVLAYWNRQYEFRLIASLLGVLYSNVANNSSDMVNDISGATGSIIVGGQTVNANAFNGNAVIDTALTIGDRLSDMKMIAMHSAVYGTALKQNESQFFEPSLEGIIIPTYKGMAVIIDDNLTTATAGVYITILFGPGALGWAVAEPRTGFGTELFRTPNLGNGGGLLCKAWRGSGQAHQ